uniref:Uncharacterized protein n=1 Tax=Aegilops tauschii subsp. strangulata TaxID=200361 RepID=A0A452Y975_AEGTS
MRCRICIFVCKYVYDDLLMHECICTRSITFFFIITKKHYLTDKGVHVFIISELWMCLFS